MPDNKLKIRDIYCEPLKISCFKQETCLARSNIFNTYFESKKSKYIEYKRNNDQTLGPNFCLL